MIARKQKQEIAYTITQAFVMFAMNYRTGWLEEAFRHKGSVMVAHLQSKFSDSYKRYGAMGAMINFWCELDSGNATDLITYIIRHTSEGQTANEAMNR